MKSCNAIDNKSIDIKNKHFYTSKVFFASKF